MENQYEIGKDIGEIKARLAYLEQLVASKTDCGCSAQTVSYHAPVPLTDEEVEKTDSKLRCIADPNDPLTHGSGLKCAPGQCKCEGRRCYVCCGNSWTVVKNGDNTYAACGVEGRTVACGFANYRLTC